MHNYCTVHTRTPYTWTYSHLRFALMCTTHVPHSYTSNRELQLYSYTLVNSYAPCIAHPFATNSCASHKSIVLECTLTLLHSLVHWARNTTQRTHQCTTHHTYPCPSVLQVLSLVHNQFLHARTQLCTVLSYTLKEAHTLAHARVLHIRLNTYPNAITHYVRNYVHRVHECTTYSYTLIRASEVSARVHLYTAHAYVTMQCSECNLVRTSAVRTRVHSYTFVSRHTHNCAFTH